jgi:hypothetical protein
VKVRLQDGRVGRVQKLVSAEEGQRGEAIVGGSGAGLGRDGGGGSASRGSGMRGGRIERDIRDEDEYLYDEHQKPDGASLGLFAALEEADQRHREELGKEGVVAEKEEVAECPVCGNFKGDERAVAHHVESHFGD